MLFQIGMKLSRDLSDSWVVNILGSIGDAQDIRINKAFSFTGYFVLPESIIGYLRKCVRPIDTRSLLVIVRKMIWMLFGNAILSALTASIEFLHTDPHLGEKLHGTFRQLGRDRFFDIRAFSDRPLKLCIFQSTIRNAHYHVFVC
jgi:hypothetical protein